MIGITINEDKLRKDVIYKMEVMPEEMSPVGNIMCSGDDAFDKKIEDEVIDRINQDDIWAWCTVKVIACVEGTSIAGVDYLGGCSYEDEEGFKEGGYYEDMKEQAFENLLSEMEFTFRDYEQYIEF